MPINEHIKFYYSLYSSKDHISSKYPLINNDNKTQTAKLIQDAKNFVTLTFGNDEIILKSYEQMKLQGVDKIVHWDARFNLSEITISLTESLEDKITWSDRIITDEITAFIRIKDGEILEFKSGFYTESNGVMENDISGAEPVDSVLDKLTKRMESVMPAQIYNHEAQQMAKTWMHTFFSGKNTPIPVQDIIYNYALKNVDWAKAQPTISKSRCSQ